MPDDSRYAPARRLLDVKAHLDATGGATLGELAEHFQVSTKTATRYLRALEDAGEPLSEDRRGREKVWRLALAGRRETITVTVSQMVALFLSGRMLESLSGSFLGPALAHYQAIAPRVVNDLTDLLNRNPAAVTE